MVCCGFRVPFPAYSLWSFELCSLIDLIYFGGFPDPRDYASVWDIQRHNQGFKKISLINSLIPCKQDLLWQKTKFYSKCVRFYFHRIFIGSLSIESLSYYLNRLSLVVTTDLLIQRAPITLSKNDESRLRTITKNANFQVQ